MFSIVAALPCRCFFVMERDVAGGISKTFVMVIRMGIFVLCLCQVVTSSSREIVKSPSCQVVKSSSCQIVKSSSRQVIDVFNCGSFS